MSGTDGPVAGWYPDPTTPGIERWWDGSAWGPQTRSVSSPTLAPPPPGPSVLGSGSIPHQMGVPVAREQAKKSGCLGIATGVMFGILGAFTILVGGCVALIASANGDDSRRGSINAGSSNPTVAPLIDSSAATSTDGISTSSRAEGEIVDYVSCSRIDDNTILLEIVNNSSKTSTYYLKVGFFDESGQRVADESATLSHLRPGERSIQEHYVFESKGSICEVIDLDRTSAESDLSEAAEIGACEVGSADALGDIEATVTVTNGSPETSNYSIDVAFVDSEGIRRGDGSFFIEAVRPGESAPGDVFSTTDYVNGLRCDVVGVDRTATR